MSGTKPQANHSPLPWTWKRSLKDRFAFSIEQVQHGGFRILGIANDTIPGIGTGIIPSDADAELIVRAVNSHGALVDALSAMLKPFDPSITGAEAMELLDRAKIQARAALKLAEEA